MNKKNIVKYTLDVFLALGFMLLFDKMAIGIQLHEIIGLIMGGAVLIHLALNYKWVIGITKKLFSKKLSNRTRLCYILNVMLFICVILIVVSGVFISKTILTNISSTNPIWKGIHMGVSNITLILIGIHIGLHWNWIMNMSKKIFKFKLPDKFSKLISVVLVLVIFVFGCYNIHSEGFIQKSFMLFISSQNGNNGHREGMKMLEGVPNFDKGNMTEEELNKIKEERQNMKHKDFKEFKGYYGNKKSLQGNHMNKKSVITLIINYMSICGVFTIITYYADKIVRKKYLNNCEKNQLKN